MATTPQNEAPAGITGIGPGESNDRASRNGLVQKSNGERQIGSASSEPAQQSVNTGEDVAMSEADVRAAESEDAQPAETVKPAKAAKAAKKPRGAKRR